MITIQNISKDFSTELQDYLLKINDQEICQFQHYKKSGLSWCLIEAGLKLLEVKGEQNEKN